MSWRRTLQSILVGLACYALAVTVTFAILTYIGPSGVVQNAGPNLDFEWLVKRIITSILIAPALESLIFCIIFVLVRLASRWMKTSMYLYVALMTSVGFLLHGATPEDVGKSLAFGLLAFHFWGNFTSTNSLWPPIAYNVVAHLVWNASSMTAAWTHNALTQ